MTEYISPTYPVVLVVEDEALLRMLAVDIVEESGFLALAAGNSAEALTLLEDHPEIGILFTDIDMPGEMNGLMLAHAVKRRWPPVQLLLVSGHKMVDQRDMPVGGRFISKPYDVDQIADTLADMTRRSRAGGIPHDPTTHAMAR